MRFNATIPAEDLRADLCRRVNAERDRIIAAGYEWRGSVYQIDPASLQAMRDTVDRRVPAVRWRTADNQMVDLDCASLARLLHDASAYVAAVRQCAMSKKDDILSSPDPRPAIVSIGWP